MAFPGAVSALAGLRPSLHAGPTSLPSPLHGRPHARLHEWASPKRFPSVPTVSSAGGSQFNQKKKRTDAVGDIFLAIMRETRNGTREILCAGTRLLPLGKGWSWGLIGAHPEVVCTLVMGGGLSLAQSSAGHP